MANIDRANTRRTVNGEPPELLRDGMVAVIPDTMPVTIPHISIITWSLNRSPRIRAFFYPKAFISANSFLRLLKLLARIKPKPAVPRTIPKTPSIMKTSR